MVSVFHVNSTVGVESKPEQMTPNLEKELKHLPNATGHNEITRLPQVEPSREKKVWKGKALQKGRAEPNYEKYQPMPHFMSFIFSQGQGVLQRGGVHIVKRKRK